MNIIAAADQNWGIGKNGGLLDHIPEDMKFFRQTTKGKTVIMGRKTLESLPGAKPLPNRVNIVVTRSKDYTAADTVVCHDLASAVEEAKKTASDSDIFFIGGSEIYHQALQYCDTAFITKIGKSYDADVFLDNFDELEDWYPAQTERITCEKGFSLEFTVYKKR